MRLLLVGFVFVLSALTLIPTSRIARADDDQHVYQILCMPGIDVFEIRNIGVFDAPRGIATGTAYDLTNNGYALYSPEWAFFQLDKPRNEVEEKFGVPFILYATRFECKLQTDIVVLVILPHEAYSYGGTIGDISVTLSVAGNWVIEGLPFHLCEDRGPITRLTYNGTDKTIRFEGRFGGVWPDKINSMYAADNSYRIYRLIDSTLGNWDSNSQIIKPHAGPLTASDVDYYQDASSESYGKPAADCL